MKTTKLMQAITKIGCIFFVMLMLGCDFLTSTETRIKNAQQYQVNTQHQAAIIELKKAIESEPEHIRARILLAESYIWLGQWANAEKELRRTAELGADGEDYQTLLAKVLLAQNRFQPLLDELPADSNASAELLSLRGEAYIASNQSEQAQAIYNQLLKQEGTRLSALLGLAKTSFADGDMVKAKEFIEQALSLDPNFIEALRVSAQIEFVAQRFEQAEQAFSKILALTNNQLPRVIQFSVLGGLVESQLQLAKVGESRRNIAMLIEQFPGHPRAQYYAAMMAYDDKNYEKSREGLRKVLQVAPNFLPAQILMGAVNFQLGNLEQADSTLTAALAANPDNAKIRKLLVATRLKRGETDAATAILDPALEAVSNDSDLLMMAGRAKIQSGEQAAGIALLEQATAQAPQNAQMQMDLAAAYLSQGQLERAISSLSDIEVAEQEQNKRDALLVFAHVQNKQADKAIHFLEAQLKENPDSANAHMLLGAVYSVGQSADADKAYQHFNRALSLDPENISALMGLGRLAVNDQDYDQAGQRFKQVHAINSGHLNAVLALAQIAEYQKDSEAAIGWLVKAVDINPQATKVKSLLFRYLFKSEKYSGLEEQTKRLLQENPSDIVSTNALVLALLKQDKQDEALAFISKASKEQPSEASFYYSLGRVYFEKENVASAKQAYQKVLDLNPVHQAAVVALVELEEKEGNISAATKLIDDYQQAEPKSTLAYVLRGNLLVRQGQPTKAAEAYSVALSLEPDNFVFLSKLYQVKQKAGDQSIEQDVQTWLQRYPSDNRAKFLLAEHYQASTRHEPAIALYEELLESDVKNFVALNNLAWLYHLKNDKRALEIAESAYKLKPDDPSIEDTLGWIKVNSGAVDEGVELLQSAVKRAPNVPDLQYHLAVGLYKQGNKDKAKPILKRLIDSDVKFGYALEAEKLYQSL